MTPPRQAAPATPPEEGNCRYGSGEFEGASGCTPLRQAELDTPPQEGNCRYGLGNLRAQGGWNFAGMTRLGEIGRCG